MTDTTVQDLPVLQAPSTDTEPTPLTPLDDLLHAAHLPDDLRARFTIALNDLRGRLARPETDLTLRTSEVAEATHQHQGDIASIGQALLAEAKRRDWCSDYDDVVDDLNLALACPLPTREKEYVFDVTVTITLNPITATDEDTARRRARAVADSLERALDAHSEIHSTSWEASQDFALQD